MAKQSKLEILINSNPKLKKEIKERWENGNLEARTELANELGYASDRSLYVILREPGIGIIPGGSCRSNGEKSESSDGAGEKAPRKQRTKGVLPAVVERWVRDGLLADFLFDGNSSDDWIGPDEITPEIFLNHRPVTNETAAYRKILDRIGGLDSEAGRALRAWAGRPLTREQSNQEEAVNVAPRDRAVAMNLLKTSNNASQSFNSAIIEFLFNQFGDEFFDRMIGNELLPI